MDRRRFLKSGAAASLAAGAVPGGVAGASWAGLHGDSAAAGSRPHRTAEGELRLMANENPLGPSEAARQAALEAMVRANQYPLDAMGQAVEAIAAKLGVPSRSVFLGAGSTEVLQIAIQALAGPNVRLVLAEPTYEDVSQYRGPFDYEPVRVPLDFRYAHDIARMREEVARFRGPTVVYLCNPNNPTGTLTPSEEIDAWIQDAPETVFFLVDEAYFELVEAPGYWSALKWIEEKPNVLVARTFSKIHGMAGLRLGYGVAHPDTTRRMRDFGLEIYGNQIALAAGMASLDDDDHVIRSRAVNAESRAVVEETLDELGLGRLESHTNFVMHAINGDLEQYIGRFRERGIRVGRPFPPMSDYNRLSLGMPEDMGRWAEVMRDFRARGWL